jgi:hypothetical protein
VATSPTARLTPRASWSQGQEEGRVGRSSTQEKKTITEVWCTSMSQVTGIDVDYNMNTRCGFLIYKPLIQDSGLNGHLSHGPIGTFTMFAPVRSNGMSYLMIKIRDLKAYPED